MVNPSAHAFIHKEHIALAHHILKQLISVAQKHGLVAAQKFFHLQTYYTQKSEIEEIFLHILQHLYFGIYHECFLHQLAHLFYKTIVLILFNFLFPSFVGAPCFKRFDSPFPRFLEKCRLYFLPLEAPVC